MTTYNGTNNALKALHINGQDLALAAGREVAVERRPVLLDADARAAVDRARAVVDTLVTNNQVSYAITTGVGKLSDVRIAGDQIRELQVNLLRSHAVGVGEPLSVPETRAMMLLRANSLSKGFSGALRIVDSRRHSCHPVARKRRSEWRSRSTRPSCPGADR